MHEKYSSYTFQLTLMSHMCQGVEMVLVKKLMDREYLALYLLVSNCKRLRIPIMKCFLLIRSIDCTRYLA